jgi:rubredoxin
MKRWQCTKCGKTVAHPTSPSPSHGAAGKCPATATRIHIFKEVK